MAADSGLAYTQGSDAILKNPAGIVRSRAREFSWVQSKLFETVDYQAVGFTGFLTDTVALGLGVIHSRVDGIEETTHSGTFTGRTIDYSDSQLMVGLAFHFKMVDDLIGSTVFDHLYGGFTYKYVMSRMHTYHAIGSGLDIGFQIRLPHNQWFGLTFVNVIQPNMLWNTPVATETQSAPYTKLGWVFEFVPNVMIAFDLFKDTITQEDRYSIGLDYSIIHLHTISMNLKAGYKDDRYTVGVGLGLGGIDFHYAMEQEHASYMNATHWMGVTLSFQAVDTP